MQQCKWSNADREISGPLSALSDPFFTGEAAVMFLKDKRPSLVPDETRQHARYYSTLTQRFVLVEKEEESCRMYDSVWEDDRPLNGAKNRNEDTYDLYYRAILRISNGGATYCSTVNRRKSRITTPLSLLARTWSGNVLIKDYASSEEVFELVTKRVCGLRTLRGRGSCARTYTPVPRAVKGCGAKKENENAVRRITWARRTPNPPSRMARELPGAIYLEQKLRCRRLGEAGSFSRERGIQLIPLVGPNEVSSQRQTGFRMAPSLGWTARHGKDAAKASHSADVFS